MEVVMKKLFEFTIKQAEQFVKNKAVDKMIEEFTKMYNKNYYIVTINK